MSHHSSEQVAPVDLLQKAQAGDRQARDHLLGWAYLTAHTYYTRKISVEETLSRADAEDLASAFYLEFARAWPRIHTLVHYTRRMLKNNLNRHLLRARYRRCREVALPYREMVRRVDARAAYASADPGATGWDWNDHEWLKYRVIGRVIRNSDSRTRELVGYRCAEPALPYREIAARTGATEAALRMRMARFYESVRRAHALAKSQTQRRQTA